MNKPFISEFREPIRIHCSDSQRGLVTLLVTGRRLSHTQEVFTPRILVSNLNLKNVPQSYGRVTLMLTEAILSLLSAERAMSCAARSPLVIRHCGIDMDERPHFWRTRGTTHGISSDVCSISCGGRTREQADTHCPPSSIVKLNYWPILNNSPIIIPLIATLRNSITLPNPLF
jgi:hypothetical protein